MRNPIAILLPKLAAQPRRIFLIDGLGALVSTASLGAVLCFFEQEFGLPTQAYTPLLVIALAFCGYSFCCFCFVGKHWRPFLRVIATANLLYCILTASVLAIHSHSVTVWAYLYFSGEILVVLSLVYVEFSLAAFGARNEGAKAGN